MNNWNIKISETNLQNGGFMLSVENNGQVVLTPKNLYKSFDKAVDDAQKIIRNRIAFFRERNKRAVFANELFVRKYINSGMYNGVYRSLIKVDTSGNPYIEVTMNTDNQNLDKLIPNVITDPKTRIDYKIVKVKPITNNTNPIV
ncbi:MAG: hypothetical protein IPJ01_11070 [Micavibrio sp.]|nr:hypothetical protein [Micavibrio sp.]